MHNISIMNVVRRALREYNNLQQSVKTKVGLSA